MLESRLREAIAKLNPELSAGAAELAVSEVTKDRSVLSPVRANQEVYQLLKDGVKVTYRTSDDEERIEIVRLIDWEEPENNDFFLASQFWISGDYGRKRADLLGFVNGIPLVFIELKASHRAIENAYKHNLSRLQRHDPATLLVQRRHHPVQWLEEQDRQHDCRVGALRRVEEDQR